MVLPSQRRFLELINTSMLVKCQKCIIIKSAIIRAEINFKEQMDNYQLRS